MDNIKIVSYASDTITNRFLKPIWQLNKLKGVKGMVDIEKIKSDITDLEILTAEEYCRPQVEAIYAEFEESRARQVAELRTSLEVFERYQVVTEADNCEEAE